MRDFIDIVLTRPPSPDSDFVEAEDQDGHSIRAGQWIFDGRYWRLRIEPASFHEDYVPDTTGIIGILSNAIHADKISPGVITAAQIAPSVVVGKRKAPSQFNAEWWVLFSLAFIFTILLVVAGVVAR